MAKKFGFILFLVCTFAVFTTHLIFLRVLFFILLVLSLYLTIFKPAKLNYLLNIWLKFSENLSKLTNPIILAFLFYFVLTPIAILISFLGRDELKLKNKEGNSFWICRDKEKFDKDFFRNLF